MGTRHLVAVIFNGEYRVAQYGQWDGYPSGVGTDICCFIKNDLIVDKFKNALVECRFIDNDYVNNAYLKCGASAEDSFVSSGISEKFKLNYPQLHRDTSSDVLKLIQDCGVRDLRNDLPFVADSLFCEWAYVIDMDNGVLEVYKGFNKQPIDASERFFSLCSDSNKEYSPVKLVKKIAFSDIDDDSLSTFESELLGE